MENGRVSFPGALSWPVNASIVGKQSRRDCGGQMEKSAAEQENGFLASEELNAKDLQRATE